MTVPPSCARSVLLSTLTIPVIYLLGCRLSNGDQMVGLLAALILAVSPFLDMFNQWEFYGLQVQLYGVQ